MQVFLGGVDVGLAEDEGVVGLAHQGALEVALGLRLELLQQGQNGKFHFAEAGGALGVKGLREKDKSYPENRAFEEKVVGKQKCLN